MPTRCAAHRVLHLVDKGNKPASMPLPSPCSEHWKPATASAHRDTCAANRARGNLDRHGVHFLTGYVAGV